MTEQASKLMKEHYDFKDLVALMELLRSEEGCPWDRAQTHESIRKNLIEECYEAIEGIDRKDDELLCEELGDILLQVVFHTVIETENNNFRLDDVSHVGFLCSALCEALNMPRTAMCQFRCRGMYLVQHHLM